MPTNLDKNDLAKTIEAVRICTNTKRGDAIIRSNNRTISMISHTTNVMLKVIQHRLAMYMEHDMAIEQGRFTKGIGT